MKLSDFLRRFSQEQRAEFAVLVGTTVGHLNNVAYGQRTASAALTKGIALHTCGQVAEWDLRPDDWHLIWPELQARPGSPLVAAGADGAAVAAHGSNQSGGGSRAAANAVPTPAIAEVGHAG